jgi:hypothetical protein
MGNTCCNDDALKGKQIDDHHVDIEKAKPNILHNSLYTVKEDPHEYSSEYRTLSRGSNNNL